MVNERLEESNDENTKVLLEMRKRATRSGALRTVGISQKLDMLMASLNLVGEEQEEESVLEAPSASEVAEAAEKMVAATRAASVMAAAARSAMAAAARARTMGETAPSTWRPRWP